MITIFLLAIYNGLFISWKQMPEKEAKLSKYWHQFRFVLMAGIAADIYFKEFYLALGWFVILLCLFNLSWTVWNFTINVVRKMCGRDIHIFHIGEGGFDGWLKSKVPIFFIWLIGLISIIFNIHSIFEVL